MALIHLGTKWLIEEHKKCVSQLEHLKTQIGDLHRVIDVIHERGGAMYHAFNELRKHLEDVQRQIKELHKSNYDNKVKDMSPVNRMEAHFCLV